MEEQKSKEQKLQDQFEGTLNRKHEKLLNQRTQLSKYLYNVSTIIITVIVLTNLQSAVLNISVLNLGEPSIWFTIFGAAFAATLAYLANYILKY